MNFDKRFKHALGGVYENQLLFLYGIILIPFILMVKNSLNGMARLLTLF